MKWYLKERNNPQLDKPYFTRLGKVSKRVAKKSTIALYGYNSLREYNSEEEYLNAIRELELSGHHVY